MSVFRGQLSRGEGAKEDVASPKKFFLKERRRAERISGMVPVMLVIRRGYQGEIIAGPAPGDIFDISLYGAGLSIEQIRVGSCHFFYSPQDNPSNVLHLQVETSSEDESGQTMISIPVRPVRFDRVLVEENALKPFYVGVEFLLGPEDEQVQLLFRLFDEKNKGKGWWQKVMNSIRGGTPPKK